MGELAAAVPEEGGYYVWVRRALGPFWGFQEAWLSLAASVFDMAIYPTLFVLYGAAVAGLGGGPWALAIELALIAVCATWNLTGARAVGRSSLAFALLLRTLCRSRRRRRGTWRPSPHLASGGWMAGILVAMWNYMGWDNACTFANKWHAPARLSSGDAGNVGLVTATYLLPTWAARHAGLDPSGSTTGSWVSAGAAVGGTWLGGALVAGGLISAFAMFNSLVLSYSRLPAALADDGYLPKLLGKRLPRGGAPWFAVLACATAYACCLGLGFDKSVQLDILLYGLSLVLEFVALIALRLRSPSWRDPSSFPADCLVPLRWACPRHCCSASHSGARWAEPTRPREPGWPAPSSQPARSSTWPAAGSGCASKPKSPPPSNHVLPTAPDRPLRAPGVTNTFPAPEEQRLHRAIHQSRWILNSQEEHFTWTTPAVATRGKHGAVRRDGTQSNRRSAP